MLCYFCAWAYAPYAYFTSVNWLEINTNISANIQPIAILFLHRCNSCCNAYLYAANVNILVLMFRLYVSQKCVPGFNNYRQYGVLCWVGWIVTLVLVMWLYPLASTQAVFIMESMMEHVAKELKMTPEEVRKVNLYKNGQVCFYCLRKDF